MNKESRRRFLATSGGLLAGAAAFGPLSISIAGEHKHGAGNGMVIDAAKKNTCATCQFWGGMRKVSKDKSKLTAQSMGWCNNPDSDNYQKLTAADHKMQKPNIWKKWPAL